MKKTLLIILGISSMLCADFTRDTNGIVTDNSTNLQWQDNEIGTGIAWEEAITRCEDLTLGDHTDWRLPNIIELTSLFDDTDTAVPLIDATFTQTASYVYWSSTTNASYASNAWVVYFTYGNQDSFDKTDSFFVRCVRAGQ